MMNHIKISEQKMQKQKVHRQKEVPMSSIIQIKEAPIFYSNSSSMMDAKERINKKRFQQRNTLNVVLWKPFPTIINFQTKTKRRSQIHNTQKESQYSKRLTNTYSVIGN